MASSDRTALNFTAPRRRVALLIHSLQGGGAERVMSQLANRWSSQHEIHLITWSKVDTDRYPLEPAIIRRGLDLQAPSQGVVGGVLANLQRVRKLRRTLRQIGPDVVLSFCDQMNIVSLEAMRSLPQIPVWIAEHSDPEKQRLSSPWEAWRRRTYPRCTGCVALTESIAQYMTRWVPREKLRVIPAVIQANTTTPTAYIATSATGLNSLLFVGRLSPEKRVENLLEAWKQIESRLNNWQLLIVGDGSQRTELQQMGSQLPRVQFLGWLEQPEQVLATSQLFVLCSRYEGFPVALLEALHSGLPAIATNCSSAMELLGTETNIQSHLSSRAIKIIPPDSVEQLANAILELASDVPLRQRMSSAARIVAQNHTWDVIGLKWDAILGGG